MTLATTATYDDEAPEYAALTGDYVNYPGLDGEVESFHRGAPAGVILDAGCGAGRDAAYLARLGRRVIAVDVSGRLLSLAAARVDLGAPGNVAFVRGDLLDLPFAPSRFAGIWACASLVHVPSGQHPGVLAALLACLVPGGILSVSMKSGAFDGFATGGSATGPRWLSKIDPAYFCAVMSSVGLCGVHATASSRGAWYVATGFAADEERATSVLPPAVGVAVGQAPADAAPGVRDVAHVTGDHRFFFIFEH